MRLFGSDRVSAVMGRLNMPEGEPITHKLISRSIEGAQKKVEARNFGIRKTLLEYDDVMNKQREAVYSSRNAALEKEDLKESVLQMIRDVVSVESYNRLSGETSGDWDVEGLQERFKELYDIDIDGEALRNLTVEGSIEDIYSQLIRIYEDKEKSLSSELLRRLEKYILLEVTDSRWRENLRTLDQLKEGIHLRAYGQSNPLVQYQLLSSEVYEDMLKTIREEVTSFLFKIRIKEEEERKVEVHRPQERMRFIHQGSDSEVEDDRHEPRKTSKVGRNDMCSCGSGKKFKNCCGR